MSYHVALSEDGRYRICRVTGPLTTELARHAGFNVRVFHDEAAALAWLNSEEGAA
jgi:hypothetical protein